MATITAEDRKKHGLPDGSFPVFSHETAMSAIKLRGHGDKAQVLAHVMRWAKKAGDQRVQKAVLDARRADRAS